MNNINFIRWVCSFFYIMAICALYVILVRFEIVCADAEYVANSVVEKEAIDSEPVVVAKPIIDIVRAAPKPTDDAVLKVSNKEDSSVLTEDSVSKITSLESELNKQRDMQQKMMLQLLDIYAVPKVNVPGKPLIDVSGKEIKREDGSVVTSADLSATLEKMSALIEKNNVEAAQIANDIADLKESGGKSNYGVGLSSSILGAIIVTSVFSAALFGGIYYMFQRKKNTLKRLQDLASGKIKPWDKKLLESVGVNSKFRDIAKRVIKQQGIDKKFNRYTAALAADSSSSAKRVGGVGLSSSDMKARKVTTGVLRADRKVKGREDVPAFKPIHVKE